MKKPTPKFKGKITLGLFLPDDTEAWARHVGEFEGKEVTTNGVKKYRKYKKRSNNQNDYYWGFVVGTPGGEYEKGEGLCGELGYTPEEMHEVLKYKFLTDIREFVFDREGRTEKKLITVPLSTQNLSTIEFETYLSNIRAWSSQDLGIWLAKPNEVGLEYELYQL